MQLSTGWSLCLTPPGACAEPQGLAGITDWIAAEVPGTVAGALQNAGRTDAYDTQDVWYRTQLPHTGPAILRLAGLATIAEVWLGDTRVLQSDNMFRAHEIAIDPAAPCTLFLCFRSLHAHLQKPGKRGRWRPRMARPPSLAGVRTSLLGHMEGWCPPVPPAGPWRAIEIIRAATGPRAEDVELTSSFENGVGILRVRLRLAGTTPGDAAALVCAGGHASFSTDGTGQCTATLHLPGIAPWWPHTHGEPTLHPVHLHIGAQTIDLGRVGFRSIGIDREADGFGFAVVCNGVRLFCRGACWTPVDLIHLPQTRAAIEPRLKRAAEAGMNMIRVGGTMLLEGESFFALCDEMGILVWHDFMFANFDYPSADPAFRASVEAEVTQFLHATRTSPSLAVVCGGSEVYQQASMMGLPDSAWRNPLFDTILPALCETLRPDLAYVPNSPSGGVLPVVSNQGVSHYYGVGAYRRPLDDARRAYVRFASECLGFANIPEDIILRSQAPVGLARHPAWHTRVPRDAGSAYDFADVRDHYLHLLYGHDPETLRAEDEGRYLELSRAAIAHVMQTSFSEWRSTRSPTAGALVWFLGDLDLGSGWGIIDATGMPKSGWYAMRQCLQPVQILLTDEGVNGLSIHLINETATAIATAVKLTCLREGSVRVVDGTRAVEIPARGAVEIPATELFGAFFDTTYAYRFGPASHDAVVAELHHAASGELLASAFYFPIGLDPTRHPLGLRASVERRADGWEVAVSTERLAQFVQIEASGFRPEHNWFHLKPNQPMRIRLHPITDTGTHPCGQVRAANGQEAVMFDAST